MFWSGFIMMASSSPASPLWLIIQWRNLFQTSPKAKERELKRRKTIQNQIYRLSRWFPAKSTSTKRPMLTSCSTSATRAARWASPPSSSCHSSSRIDFPTGLSKKSAKTLPFNKVDLLLIRFFFKISSSQTFFGLKNAEKEDRSKSGAGNFFILTGTIFLRV